LLKGWPTHEQTGTENPSDILRPPIEFLAPGCSSTARIFLVDLNLQMMPMLDQVIEAGYARRIVYMGRTWPGEDRLGLRLEWLKHKALALSALGDTSRTRQRSSSQSRPAVGLPTCWTGVWPGIVRHSQECQKATRSEAPGIP
jgi:hypothetical protein